MALVRRRLVHPEQASVAGEDGFRFHHALIRDSVYGAIDEQARARLHERVARALAARGGRDEVVGYHLEQAARVDATLAAEAGQRLGAAGVRAMRRFDVQVAIDLLTRAIPLVGSAEARLELECALGTTVKFSGDTERAQQLLVDVAVRADAAGNRRVASLARSSACGQSSQADR